MIETCHRFPVNPATFVASLMHPTIDPYKISSLPVTGGHVLYYEECGNPQGIPVVFLHGGPGGGLHPDMRRFFDPAQYRIILFDQRGCGNSSPYAEIKDNTIEDLVADIDRLRAHLAIEKWGIMGASWGTALAMFYAIQHPERVSFMVLAGVFLADKDGKSLLCEGLGVKEKFSAEFGMYQDLIPPEKRGEGLGKAYYEILTGGDSELIREAVARFTLWAGSTSGKRADKQRIKEVYENIDQNLPLTKIYLHFATNFYNDQRRQYILSGAGLLSSIPCSIFHGENDVNCPIENAIALHKSYPNSILNIIPEGGHSARDKKNAAAIVSYTDQLAKNIRLQHG